MKLVYTAPSHLVAVFFIFAKKNGLAELFRFMSPMRDRPHAALALARRDSRNDSYDRTSLDFLRESFLYASRADSASE